MSGLVFWVSELILWVSGQADGRTGGPARLQASGSADGRADGRTRSPAGERVGGRADGRPGGRADGAVLAATLTNRPPKGDKSKGFISIFVDF